MLQSQRSLALVLAVLGLVVLARHLTTVDATDPLPPAERGRQEREDAAWRRVGEAVESGRELVPAWPAEE